MAHHHHHHGEGCSHGHHHPAPPAHFDKRFAAGAAVNMGFVLAQVAFGMLAHSLALVADAAHNFSDVIGLLLAWGGAFLARMNPTAERTYGYGGATILAALGNAALLFVATGAIALEAVERLFHPAPIQSGIVIAVAILGILINFGTAMMFRHGKDGDINVKGAYLHMMADAAISLGVVLAALAIRATGWLWIDPVTSFIISFIVLRGSWDLAKEALHMSLAGVPRHIDRDAVHGYLSGLSGVTEVHDLHIWAMSTTETALTAHILRPASLLDDAFLQETAQELKNRFRIHHPTLQVETGKADCKLAPENVI